MALLVGVGAAACSPAVAEEAPWLRPGGCRITLVTPTERRPFAELTNRGRLQERECRLLVSSWNGEPHVMGDAARFECGCPPARR